MAFRLLSAAFALVLLTLPASAALAQDSSPIEVQVLTLQPPAGSMASGWAWVVPQMGQMIVTTLVMGLEPGSMHSNHIHRGSCETPGGIVYGLTDLTANADGVATATTLVNADMEMMGMGTHYVQVHVGILGTSPAASPRITCGNIGGMME